MHVVQAERSKDRGGGFDEHWRYFRDRHRWRLAGGLVRLLARVLGALVAVSGALSALLVNETSRLRRDRDHINHSPANLNRKARAGLKTRAGTRILYVYTVTH